MAKNSKDYELAIKIAGEIEKSFYSSTKLTKSELNNIAKEAARTSSEVKNSFGSGFRDIGNVFDGIGNVAKKAFKVTAEAALLASTAIAGVAAASISVGMAYESAFAGVKKTTDATAEEYEALRQGIIAMTKEIPASAVEIAEVAEAAGQLGIEKEALLEFSKVMIDLGESTNLTSTEAASSLAKFANITRMASDQYDQLGSVIVALGNNFATTEADIVSMATRMAATGELTGLTQAQIMAISTAMSSVGIEAEAGGSAMSKLLKNIQVAVETGKNGLKDYASTAGLTSKDFQKLFKEDALQALSAFIEGLNDTKRNGKSATLILEDMGLTEVRLSNTILSLANANGVMSNAVSTANKAWEENVALQNEANQRYDTTESKLSIMKNGIKSLGIAVYDDLSGAFREGISFVTNGIHNLTDQIKSTGAVSNFVDGIKKNIPTVIRHVKEFTSSFLEFINPVLRFGGWLVDNPEVIASAIASVGTALVTYKIANGIMGISSAIKVLIGLFVAHPILGTITAAGMAIAGLVTYFKMADKKLKNQNLAEHFGTLTLSMQELQDVASYIIRTDSFGKLSEAMKAFDDMQSIRKSIDETVNSLNKANWKVSIGMVLTKDEQESYMLDIKNFISDSQNLLLQKQYAMKLNLEVFTDNDLDGMDIRRTVDEFYLGNNQELTRLGTELQECVNKAFSDGLLSGPEMEEIIKLQEKMAKITEKVAESKFEGKMSLLQMKLGGGDLDADTFQNLQAELYKQADEAKSQYDEGYILAVSNAKVMFDEGEINKSEYDKQIAEYKENYLENIGIIDLKVSQFQTDTILAQYSDEVTALKSNIDSTLKETIDYVNFSGNSALGWDSEVILDNLQIDKGTMLALKDLTSNMQGTVDAIEKMKELNGGILPDEYMKIEEDLNILKTLAGDTSSMWKEVGNVTTTADDSTKNGLVDLFLNNFYLPEEIVQSIRGDLVKSVRDTYDFVDSEFKTTFDKELDVSVPVNILYNVSGSHMKSFANMKGYATGGIITTPTVAKFAENGPEAAIPLDGSKNAIDLWHLTGDLLGIDSREDSISSLSNSVGRTNVSETSSATVPSINYSPVLNFYGEKPEKSDLDKALNMSQNQFNTMLDKYFHNKKRLEFN